MAVTGSQISNKKAARRSGLSPSYVGRVMRGLRDPRLSTAAKIAAHKRLTLDQLFDIVQRRRKLAVNLNDPKSGINPKRKIRDKARAEGGYVEAPVNVDIDLGPMPVVEPGDGVGFEIYGDK